MNTTTTDIDDESVEEERNQLDRILQGQTNIQRDLAQAKTLMAQGNTAGAQDDQGLNLRLHSLRGMIRSLNVTELRNVERGANRSQDQLRALREQLTVILLGTLLVMLAFAYFTLRAINRPLQRLVVAANQFGSGDLNVAVDGRMPEELRVLANAFTGMADRFRKIVGETVGPRTRSALRVGPVEHLGGSRGIERRSVDGNDRHHERRGRAGVRSAHGRVRRSSACA